MRKQERKESERRKKTSPQALKLQLRISLDSGLDLLDVGLNHISHLLFLLAFLLLSSLFFPLSLSHPVERRRVADILHRHVLLKLHVVHRQGSQHFQGRAGHSTYPPTSFALSTHKMHLDI